VNLKNDGTGCQLNDSDHESWSYAWSESRNIIYSQYSLLTLHYQQIFHKYNASSPQELTRIVPQRETDLFQHLQLPNSSTKPASRCHLTVFLAPSASSTHLSKRTIKRQSHPRKSLAERPCSLRSSHRYPTGTPYLSYNQQHYRLGSQWIPWCHDRAPISRSSSGSHNNRPPIAFCI
jgi:hypothetical protein